MLLFAIGETRLLAGDVSSESDLLIALSALPEGVRSYLSEGKSLPRRRERLAAVRLLLHLLEHQGLSTDVRIGRDGWGRPHFDDPALPDFNLSHSDGFVAVAMGDGRVGIDLQSVNADFDPVSLANRFFSPAEASAIEAAREDARADLFFALWTKKEALGKAVGKGLADVLGGNVGDPLPIATQKRALGGKAFFLSVYGDGEPTEIRL